jgi:hypothetical protein
MKTLFKLILSAKTTSLPLAKNEPPGKKNIAIFILLR